MRSKEYSISFCTVCMNRLHHLKETLLQNIKDNEGYDELQFIVLDYNSKDGTEAWIKEEMSTHISSGKLIYYRTEESDKWNPSHSKNIVFKLADGDILCNIWADYYAGRGFAHYVNSEFTENDNIVLTPIDFFKTKAGYHPPADVLGKVCVKKIDFLKIGGFDESMNKHGFEDYDFINRLEFINVKRVLIEEVSYLKFISHKDTERYSLQLDALEGVYVKYCTPSLSECLILYKDLSSEKGVLVDNAVIYSEKCTYAYRPRDHRFEYSVKEPGWLKGIWKEESNGSFQLSFEQGGETVCSVYHRNGTVALINMENNDIFYNLLDTKIARGLLVFKHLFDTRVIMEENLKNKSALVNLNGFGKAMVFKNFQSESPIYLI